MTAERVLDNMVEAFERGVADVDDYTVVTNLYTAYYKKVMENGRPTFEARTKVRGMDRMHDEAVEQSMLSHSDFFASETYETARANARYEGRATVDGVETHHLYIPVIEQFGDGTEDHEPMEDVNVFIDAERWVLRKMEFKTEFERGPGDLRTVRPEIHMQDYRDVEGMYIPFRTVVLVEGIDEMISPEEREEARRGLQEIERQLGNMPEEQRRMMKRMVEPQIQQLEQILENDAFEMVHEVKEVKVNTGLPEGLF